MMETLGALAFLALGKGFQYVSKLFADYKANKARQDKLKRQPILTLTEIRKRLKENPSLKNEKFVLVSTSCIKSQKLTETYSIGSNQDFFNRVPLACMMERAQSQLKPRQSEHSRICWTAEDNTKFPFPLILSPQLIQHTIHYQSIFDRQNPPWFLQKLFLYILAGLAALFSIFGISGPQWGTLHLTTSLTTNIPFILCCSIQQGQLIPQILALQRQDIIKFFQPSETKSYFLAFGISSLLLAICYKPMMSFLKMIFSTIKRQFLAYSRPRPYVSQVGDDQKCIICYEHCKNVMFKNCKHMIICHKCLRDNEIRTCPLCRVDITETVNLMYKMF